MTDSRLNKLSFGKEFRLLSAEDFSHLRHNSLSKKNKWLKIYFKKNRLGSDETRIGLTVSKKVGKAHLRSRTKRVLRETFRISEFRNLGVDVLILVSPYLYKNITDEAEAQKILSKSLVHVLGLMNSELSS